MSGRDGQEPAKPRVVGRYALYGEIASGGMATVHFGRLLGPVGFSRTVAIKRLHPQFAKDPDFVSMFLDEARVAARVQHPNVVSTLDVVALEDELLLVMEYVQGESLSRLMRALRPREGKVDVRVAASILSGVLHGLHAAHEACSEHGEPLGIVHRDVSPQNVMIGSDGTARVVDFGVAKAANRVQTTREGQIKGKLAYMAPEQLDGPVDRRVDVYGAAIVLWEAITGRRLFDGEHDGVIFSKVVEGATEPPSRYAPEVSPALDALVMRGLARDPAARFATAREMAVALEEAVHLATPRQVGEWVESVAGDSLARRAGRVKEIESISSTSAPRLSFTGGAKQAQSAAPPPGGESQISSISVSSGSALGGARRSLALPIAVVVAALAAGGALALWVRPGPGVAASSAAAEVSAAALAPTEPAPTVAPSPAAPPTSSAAPAPVASSEPSVARVPTSRRPPTRAPAKPRCDPPYSIRRQRHPSRQARVHVIERRAHRRTGIGAALLLSLVAATSSRAANADDKKACAAAYEKAQEERRLGHLSAARAELLVCAQDACSIVVRKDCAAWLTEVDSSLPTIVVEVRDANGADVAEVKVSVDGRVVKERLDGKAFAIDPGEHSLRFDLAGAPAKQQKIIAREGEKNRRVAVSFAAASGSSPPPVEPESAPRAPDGERRFVGPTVVAAGVGVAGVAGYAVFGLLALGQKSDLQKSCAPNCSDAQVSPVRTKVAIADVSIAVGAVGLGLATTLFFLGRPSRPAAASSALAVDATPLPGGAAASLRASF